MTASADGRLRDLLATIDRDETIALARALVRLPSVTGHEGLKISNYMAGWLEANAIPSGIQVVGENRANVYGRIDGRSKGPRLLLNGHLDTKPGDSMTIDPYG